jgi:hypothetical protein
LEKPVGLPQGRHGRSREAADGGAAASDLLHGEQRYCWAGGDDPHHGLAVLDEHGDELGGEEGLLQNARDDREPACRAS